jgi:hypothetical protein
LATLDANVLRVDTDSGRITTFRHAVTELSGFVGAILLDHTGSVWLGAQTGLDRFEPETGQVTHFTQKDGLASNVVSCILEDATGALWMGTSNGLSRLDASRRVFTSYGPGDGLPGPDLSGWGACFRSNDGWPSLEELSASTTALVRSWVWHSRCWGRVNILWTDGSSGASASNSGASPPAVAVQRVPGLRP